MTNARKFIANPDWAAMLLDTQAAIDAVKGVGPVGIVGFCLAAASPCGRPPSCRACRRRRYYGGPSFASPRQAESADGNCISARRMPHSLWTDIETIKTKATRCRVFIYPGAQHGFHCDERASYDKTAPTWLARSLEFFAKHLK